MHVSNMLGQSQLAPPPPGLTREPFCAQTGSALADALARNGCLRILHATDNSLNGPCPDKLLAALEHNTRLRALHLAFNSIEDEQLRLIEEALERNRAEHG